MADGRTHFSSTVILNRIGAVLRILLPVLALVAGAGCGRDPEEVVRVDVTEDFLRRHHVHGVVDFDASPARVALDGWHDPEPLGRWSAAKDAFVTIDLEDAASGVLEIALGHIDPTRPPKTLTLSVNGLVIGEIETTAAVTIHRAAIPDAVLRPGPNEIGLACDVLHPRGSRRLGVFVDWLRVRSAAAAQRAYVPGRTSPFLAPDESVDFEAGYATAGTFDIGWESESPVEGRIAFVGRGTMAESPQIWTSAKVEGLQGRVTLRVSDRARRHEPSRLVLLAEDSAARLRITDVARSTVARDDVLLIVIDTLRADALSCYGASAVETAHIDSLAAAGTLFRNAVSHAPITGPSHAAMFTSQYPSVAGIVNNHEGMLARDVATLPEILRRNGYATRGVVSIDPITRRNGFDRGFDIWDEEIGLAFLRRGSDALAALRTWMADATLDPDRPRFTFVHLAEPHEPYDAHGTVDAKADISIDGEPLVSVGLADFAPQRVSLSLEAGAHEFALDSTSTVFVRRLEIVDRESTGARFDEFPPRRGPWETTLTLDEAGTIDLLVALNDTDIGVDEIQRRYRLEVEETDRLVGEVLDALRASGRADRTWVVFTADHGECLGEHGHVGHVRHVFETAVHVPLIVSPPTGRSAFRHAVREDLAAGIDVLPTLLDAVGLDPPADLEGRSLVTPSDDDRVVLVQTNTPQAPSTLYAHRAKNWKLIWNVASGTVKFFDLAADPGETRDVSAGLGVLFDRRRRALEDHVADVHARRERARSVMDPETAAALRALGYIE